ncbi:MAG: hypothetical protein K0S63_755, partial [Gammaproteobacteria bacterium]|nr:hypothetical protein [Gammaproteobacteria bacterium]
DGRLNIEHSPSVRSRRSNIPYQHPPQSMLASVVVASVHAPICCNAFSQEKNNGSINAQYHCHRCELLFCKYCEYHTLELRIDDFKTAEKIYCEECNSRLSTLLKHLNSTS